MPTKLCAQCVKYVEYSNINVNCNLGHVHNSFYDTCGIFLTWEPNYSSEKIMQKESVRTQEEQSEQGLLFAYIANYLISWCWKFNLKKFASLRDLKSDFLTHGIYKEF